ncbi:hypothetical protein [uncultured Sphingomonas sp.]|uniref:hypothetical protein n=1 Tax=uncultured Sphingomonas sp. TaxID=158754 RepID=UPI0035CC4C84
MAEADDTSPDLFADIDQGVGGGSGEGTAQVGGDPGETVPGSEPDEGDMNPFGDPDEEGDAAPSGDAPIAAAIVSTASSSGVGHRDADDTGDIGSTDGMTASFGGLAGTSR